MKYVCPLCGEQCDYEDAEYVDFGTPDWVCWKCAIAVKEKNYE